MEGTERETHDFMNVESFSQLPFIRPATVKKKSIRLFGKDFGGGTTAVTADESDSGDTNPSEELLKDSDNGESSRKFECHYCCRNFPTSQALGGHQNAHKRERQHAKRAHLQSAAMVHSGYYAYHRPPPPPMVAAMNYHHQQQQSWNNNITSTSAFAISNPNPNPRFYGTSTHGSYSSPLPPINGSPLGLWRIPAIQQNSGSINHDRSMLHQPPLPLYAGDELKPSSMIGGTALSSSQTRYVYEAKPNIQDQVSLDLHL